MNMKKTMAAIAAGAVAVSAMATTVSAATLETKTLTYNLVKTVKEGNDAEVKLTAKFFNVPLVADETARFYVKNLDDTDIIRISGVYLEENKQIVPITATKDQGQEGVYSIVTANAMTIGANGFFDVDIKAANQQNGFTLMGGTAAVDGDPEEPATLSKPATDAVANLPAVGTQATMNTKATDKIVFTVNHTNQANAATFTAQVGTDAAVSGITIEQLASNWGIDASEVAAWGANAAGDGSTGAGSDNGKKFEVSKYVAATEGTPAQTVSANITVEVTKKKLGNIINELKVGNAAYDGNYGLSGVNAELAKAASVLGVGLTVDATPGVPSTNTFNVQAGITKQDAFIVASDFAKTQTVRQYPYKSSLNNNLYTATSAFNVTGGDAEGGDILNHIYEVKSDDTAAQITRQSIQAVLNDAISKYDDVTFVFNTATKKVVTDATWTNVGGVGTYTDNDWDAAGVTDYTSFGNHIYNALQYGYDPNTAYILNEWKPDNLFSGALLVNSTLTLSLTDTQKFDWTEKSLSFTWEAVQDAALTNNAYANYIQNMVLRTSQDWYWDNMQVVLGETEVEEVEAGAPVEGDEADLPEDDADIDDIDEPEEPAEVDEPEEPAEAEEPAAAPAASNPSTGNAPVALAVIPVALAAAAIVAKKRG